MDNLLTMYAKDYGLRYDPEELLLTPNEAAKISGVSANVYNDSLRQVASQGRSPDKSGPAVAATPQVAAEPPPPADDKVPTEPIKVDEPGPIEDAAKSALKARVAEMQQAEAFVRQQQQAPPKATEPQAPTLEQAIANFPERIKRWYAARPEYFTDPEKVAQLQYTHWVARRETGEEFTDPYFDRMEVLLGFKRAAQPHGNGAQRDSIPTEPVNVSASPPPPPPRDTAPHTLAPPVRRQVPAAPVSAPPTRDAPSMVSGRPTGEPLRLTREQQDIARSLGLSDEEYRAGLRRMNSEKAAGFHTDGGR